MELSVVTTLYHSQDHLAAFYERMRAAAEAAFRDVEFIFVNDGSPDGSLAEALELQRRDPRISVLDLSKNFGHHRAMMAGLAQARGRYVFLIDCDLEEDPAWLGLFWRVLQEQQADLVHGVQAKRKGGWSERWLGALFYRVFNALSDVPLEPNPTTARLMTGRFVESLLKHEERELFFIGLCAITGYRQVPVRVEKKSKGSTTYSLKRRIALALNAITSFSETPLVFIFYLGLVLCALSGLASLWLVYLWMMRDIAVAGWPSLIVSLWLIGGLIIMLLGIVGIYIARVFIEVKRRPYVIVRAHHPGSVPGAEPSTHEDQPALRRS